MKLLLAASLLLYSCGPSKVEHGTSDLYIYPDKNHGVICYRVGATSGLSCVQINSVGK